MLNLLSRRRYEALALGISLFCAGLHLWSDREPSTGLSVGDTGTSAIGALGRGVHLLEAKAIDLKFRLRGSTPANPAVLVVEVDEKSAQKYGLWPWPRKLMAQALTHLLEAKVAAIGLDIAFTDEAGDDGHLYRELLTRFDQTPGADAATLEPFRAQLLSGASSTPDSELEAAFKLGGARIVQGVIAYPEEELKSFAPAKVAEHLELLQGHLFDVEGNVPHSTFSIDKVEAWPMYAAQTPLRRFAAGGSRFGHFSYVPDLDGTIRRSPLVLKLTGAKGMLPSLPLAVAAAYLDANLVPLQKGRFVSGVRIEPKSGAPFEVPFQSNEPYFLINYPGPASSFSRVSIGDLIEGTFDHAQVEGKAALIGITITGSMGDQRVTPFSEFSPGIFAHAAVLSSLLSRNFLMRPALMGVLEAAIMIALGLLLSALIPRLVSFRLKAAWILGLALAWLLADELLFARGVQLATVMPVFSLLSTSFGLIFLGYLSVDREKGKMRETFKKYLGDEVMEEALKYPEKLNRGEKREMTVLFSDIRGFTTLSERMLPEKLFDFIKEYLSPMTQIVFEEKGTLDKYIGDALMAFWNAPLDQNDHALRACRAAWKMLIKLEELKAAWRANNFPEFDIGVGINTGPMTVGNMGSDVRVDYTVMGDAVNLASRLEGTNKEYETRIIISEATWTQVKDEVICRRLGAVRVKGKRKPVRIYEIRGLGKAGEADSRAIDAFEAALEAYAEQRWDDAQQAFEAVLLVWPADPPARRYLEELPALKSRPPGAGWDGVYTATTK